MWKDSALALDILVASRKALEFLKDVGWESFNKDEVLQHAAIHLLTIMGEAASKISQDFKSSHPEIPWRDLIGMRNQLVHEYFRIDLDEVWSTIIFDLPALISALEPLVPKDE
jgi:uncharacterized protein with HEPN domain